MASNRELKPGWIQIYQGAYSEGCREYWAPNALPVVEEDKSNAKGTDGQPRWSEVYASDKGGGIGPIQWVNDLEGKGVILLATGGWREGGTFKVFACRELGTVPIDITNRFQLPVIPKGEPSGWETPLHEAAEIVLKGLGILA